MLNTRERGRGAKTGGQLGRGGEEGPSEMNLWWEHRENKAGRVTGPLKRRVCVWLEPRGCGEAGWEKELGLRMGKRETGWGRGRERERETAKEKLKHCCITVGRGCLHRAGVRTAHLSGRQMPCRGRTLLCMSGWVHFSVERIWARYGSTKCRENPKLSKNSSPKLHLDFMS